MPIKIDELIDNVKQEQAVEYAKFELEQHDHRVNNKARSLLARYTMSTPTKLHMSSLMFIAWQEKRWITATEAAKKLHISRQAAQYILRECYDAGWVICERNGYRYSDNCAAHYIQAVDEMLVSTTTNFTENMQKLITLREIASTHLSLTSDNRSNDNDVREVKYG